MAELTVDLTYGTALAAAAKETERESDILEEGMQIADIMENEPDFKRFLCYPGISIEEKKKVWLCACKQTNNPPFCDGSHKNL